MRKQFECHAAVICQFNVTDMLSHSDAQQNQHFDWFSNCEEPVGRLQPIRAQDKGEYKH